MKDRTLKTETPVSYTHLDVYKRQTFMWTGHEFIFQPLNPLISYTT